MTIKVTKPSINLREALSDLDFDKVPFQKMPAGSVLQVVDNFWSGDATTSNASGGQSSLYGLTAGRVYGDIVSVTIKPRSSNSKFVIISLVGLSSTTRSSKGAFGVSLVKDNIIGYATSPYPNYPANATSNYPEDAPGHWVVDNTSVNASTFYLKGFAYNESSPTSAQTIRVQTGQLTVMEIAQ
jgi:hypothetical protein